MALKLLEFVATRPFWGMVLVMGIGSLWLVSADTVGDWFGGDIGVMVLYVVLRMCLTPVTLLIAAWLIVTGVR